MTVTADITWWLQSNWDHCQVPHSGSTEASLARHHQTYQHIPRPTADSRSRPSCCCRIQNKLQPFEKSRVCLWPETSGIVSIIQQRWVSLWADWSKSRASSASSLRWPTQRHQQLPAHSQATSIIHRYNSERYRGLYWCLFIAPSPTTRCSSSNFFQVVGYDEWFHFLYFM